MLLFDLIFPKFCLGCNKWGAYLCLNCQKEILQGDLVCPICEKLAIGGKTHPICTKKYGLDGLWSLGVYGGTLKKGIQKLKYKFVTELAEALVNLLLIYSAKYTPLFIEEIKKNRGEGWIIVPVPLYPKREKWRGFNQSALLAKILAKKLGLKYGDYLLRIKHTKPQMKLKGWERKKNIKNAFALAVNSSLLAESILLVDDVWTTGSTLKECCKVLKLGGAKKVWALTLAR